MQHEPENCTFLKNAMLHFSKRSNFELRVALILQKWCCRFFQNVECTSALVHSSSHELDCNLIDEICKQLTLMAIPHQISSRLTHFFASNLSMSIPDKELQFLIDNELPGSTIRRFRNNRKIGILSVPSTLVEKNSKIHF